VNDIIADPPDGDLDDPTELDALTRDAVTRILDVSR
jgi:hypothetical protein